MSSAKSHPLLAAGRTAASGVAITGATLMFLYNNRGMEASTAQPTPVVTAPQPAAPLPVLDLEHGPVFNPEETTVIFILGGPGVGKGTQCSQIAKEMNYVHLSAGDLLREERGRKGSPYGELIDHVIKEGRIVPHQITINLLLNAMKAHPKNKKFLIDGFPRNVEQGIEFEIAVCPSKGVLFFDCDEDTLLKRLQVRSTNSGRADDNIETIKKRFRTYQESTLPVKDFYHDLGKMTVISGNGSIEQVHDLTVHALKEFETK